MATPNTALEQFIRSIHLCGGRRTMKAVFSTHQAAEERLVALRMHAPSRLLPSACRLLQVSTAALDVSLPAPKPRPEHPGSAPVDPSGARARLATLPTWGWLYSAERA